MINKIDLQIIFTMLLSYLTLSVKKFIECVCYFFFCNTVCAQKVEVDKQSAENSLRKQRSVREPR